MRATEAGRKVSRPRARLGATLALLLGVGLSLPAQEQQTARAVPVVTGYSGFIVTLGPGKQELEPIFTPIFLVPLGERFLVEAEFEGVVVKNPYFVQTKAGGTFRIANVPPGRHRLRSWHERLPAREQEVEVPVEGTVQVLFNRSSRNH